MKSATLTCWRYYQILEIGLSLSEAWPPLPGYRISTGTVDACTGTVGRRCGIYTVYH